MQRVTAIFTGEGLLARALRSSALTVAGFGGSQVLRLASNLILARLLFPEAFGVMAIVSVIIQGLMQFSDVGVSPAIMQSKRGDDPAFLDTAWTIQAARGIGLWLVACALAWPVAWIYDESLLMQLLPVAGLSLLLTGFNPTALDTAKRHLRWGRVTAIEFAVQIAGIVAAVALAWWWQSVWALVVSGVLSAGLALVLFWTCLSDATNRIRWEPPAAKELISFGKWIFLSTICGFLFNQADKLILGKYLSFDVFGVYNIGFFLASFPMLLGHMLTWRLLIPIYRELPPGDGPQNFAKLRRMRFAVTGGLMALAFGFAVLGVWLVDLMYDDRYAVAGAVVVLMALMQIPQIIVMTYDQASLAAGDSRRFFILTLAKAAVMILALVAGLEWGGLMGALLGYGAAMGIAYPVVVWLARRMRAWDPLHDALMAGLGITVGVVAVWLNIGAISDLATLSGW
ncbi:oligosaccharide flippase family protein [uncultured Roseovarius sp.]|uniref:oligosaccharide flippase family protein n=1 Tax=uncultured Roseovarius sp. TaxID=293344 RepID=UPI00260EDAC0|nr:oligosaccharide flippase family protein [uncultured Roseovarius sp.]